METIDPGLLGRQVALVASSTFGTLATRNLVGATGVIWGVHSLDGAGYTSTWFLIEVTHGPTTLFVTVPEQCVQATPAPAAHAGYFPPEYIGGSPIIPIPEKPAG